MAQGTDGVQLESIANPQVKVRMTYAVEVEYNEQELREPDTRHYRHPWCYDKNRGNLAERPETLPAGEPGTIASLFSASSTKFADNRCMGTRTILECTIENKKQYWSKGPLEWRTYRQVSEDVKAVASGLMGLDGMQELRQAGKCVAAILADTSAEWQISAQACFRCGLPVTTVYTTLGHEAMLHGLKETEASVLFVDWGQYHTLQKPVLSQCEALKYIVLIGKCFVPVKTVGGESQPFPSKEEVLPQIGQASTLTLESLMASGTAAVDVAQYAPKEEDLAFIMYTSGSTGLPKGVMLTHKNFVALLASVISQGTVTPTPKDVFVAFLPLAHILELMVETACLVQGASIGYAHARTLTPASPYMHPSKPEGADLLACRPTILVAVPSILEVIKTGLGIKLGKLPGLKGKLVRGAVNKAQRLPSGEGGMARALLAMGISGVLLKKVRAGLGLERLRFIASGGAPLAAATQDYIGAVLAPVAQGYGATETTGCTTAQECIAASGRPADRSSGSVGAIQPACELKLVSVPEMGYLVTDSPPRGEILVAGNTVSQQGYFKLEEKSREDFPRHSDGKVWFHTGDIGVMNENGTLKIVDRKKDLIKLSGGEYVSLGKVESVLKQVEGIGAVVVFAQAHKDHCVAIVSQPERGWDSVGGKPDEDELREKVEKKLRALGLARFEIPTKLKVDESIWTPETGLVTASLKVQRNPLREYYNGDTGLLAAMDYRFPTS